MVDPKDEDPSCLLIDLVHDAVRPSARGPKARELRMEWMADLVRVLEKRAQHELDHRGRSLGREAGERPVRRGSYAQPPLDRVTARRGTGP